MSRSGGVGHGSRGHHWGAREISGSSEWRHKSPLSPEHSLFSICNVVTSTNWSICWRRNHCNTLSSELDGTFPSLMAFLNSPVYGQPYWKEMGIKTNYPIIVYNHLINGYSKDDQLMLFSTTANEGSK